MRRPLALFALASLLAAAPAVRAEETRIRGPGETTPDPRGPRPVPSGEVPAPGGDVPDGPSVKDVVARVQAFYDKTRTFRAKFHQEYSIKLHGETKTSDGVVVFQKPGKMIWRYAEPNGNRVVSDGKLLRVFEKSNQQMFEQNVDKSQYPAALAFLMGQGDLDKAFTLRLVNVKFEGGYVVEGVPREDTPAYKKVLLYVDGATAQVRRVLILDAQGNRNRFDFDAPEVNQPVTDAEFVFTPPPGTQVIHP